MYVQKFTHMKTMTMHTLHPAAAPRRKNARMTLSGKKWRGTLTRRTMKAQQPWASFSKTEEALQIKWKFENQPFTVNTNKSCADNVGNSCLTCSDSGLCLDLCLFTTRHYSYSSEDYQGLNKVIWTKEISFHSHKLLIEHKRGEQFNQISHDEIVLCFCFSVLMLRESYAWFGR